MSWCSFLGHLPRLNDTGQEIQCRCASCGRIFASMENPVWRLRTAPDSPEKAEQREISAAIIMEDCRQNWIYGATAQGCAHTILADAVLKNRVPERATLPHQ